MPRVTCRCGETLSVPDDGPDRVVCPRCAAKIRVRRPKKLGDIDGFIRFACPCGRRLKVRATGSPQAGKCPDCGRIVPVPDSSSSPNLLTGNPESPTEELSTEDVTRLEQWAQERLERTGAHTALAVPAAAPGPPATVKMEAGLRVCPRCGRPVHLGAIVCRECGAHVPKR
jgi:hypothetical protein